MTTSQAGRSVTDMTTNRAYPVTYPTQPPRPPSGNAGLNFAGYTIGIGVLLMIVLPVLMVIGCCLAVPLIGTLSDHTP